MGYIIYLRSYSIWFDESVTEEEEEEEVRNEVECRKS